jgi:glycosyltransferase involved in cell wall biosynthesis
MKGSGRGLDRYAYELVHGVSQESSYDTRIVSTPTSRADYIIREAETVFRLRGVEAKIYHATSEYGLASLILAKKRPIVVTVHDLIPQFFFRYSPVIYSNQRLHLSLVRHADRVIASSHFYSRLLQQKFDVPKSRIDVIRYGVDHTLFRSSHERNLGAPPTILYLGALRSLKGAKDLIHAFSLVARSNDVRLLIGGRGRYATKLREMAEYLGVAKNVNFLGFVEEETLPALYNSSDVMVWPSYTGFGLSTLEAMACATPVVTAKCLDSEEYLREMGLLYDPGDAEGLAKVLEHVIASRSSWKDWSLRALKSSENFSWTKMARETCETYGRVIQ